MRGCHFFLRKQTFFLFNRVYLLTGLIGSFLLPFIQFSYVEVINTPTIPLENALNKLSIENSNHSSFSIWLLTLIIYLVGFVFIIVKNIKSYRLLHKIKKEGKYQKNKGYVLVDSEKIKSSFSTLNYIFINSNKLQAKEKDIILKHELNHIKEKHWVDLIFSECALSLQWFNPIIWLYIHWIKENHEYLADNAVLKAGESSSIYCAVLINQQFQNPIFSITNTFSYPNNLNRLNMMKKNKSKSWKKIRVLAIIPFMVVFFTLSAKPNYVKSKNTVFSKMNDVQNLHLSAHNNPTIYINGEKSNSEELNKLDVHSIESLSVLKGKEATDLYGEEGKYGIIRVTLKQNIVFNEMSNKTQDIKTNTNSNFKIRGLSKENSPLVVIDGEIQANIEILNNIDPQTIDKISVIKDNSENSTYGEKGKNGIILVTLKKESKQNPSGTVNSNK